MLLPVLGFLVGVMVWGVLAGAAQVRCVDAAREAARAAARGDPRERVVAAARRSAPSDASVEVSESDDTVLVRVTAVSRAPGGLGGLLSVRVSANAVAAREPGEPGGLGEPGESGSPGASR